MVVVSTTVATVVTLVAIALLCCGLNDGVQASDTYCKVANTITGDTVFDLTPLRRSGNESNYVVTDSRGHTYYLNVCGDLTPTGAAERCTSKFSTSPISVCQDKEGGSGNFPHHAGSSSTPPSLQDQADTSQGVVLQYSRTSDLSDACSTGSTRVTKIIFSCGPSRGRPIFLSETSHCQYTFLWKTDLVCDNVPSTPVDELPCYTHDSEGHVIDLSPLVSSVRNWEVLDETHATDIYKYFISICRPLVPSDACANKDHSAACQTRITHPESFTDVSLGLAATPSINEYGEISMLYESGDDCESSNTHRHTQIFFSCPSTPSLGLGSPKFREEIDCFYIFDWETTAACVQRPAESSTCAVTDSYDTTFDFEPLKDKIFTAYFAGKRFDFGLCGTHVVCGEKSEQVAVCQDQNTPLATSSGVLEVIDGNLQSTFNDTDTEVVVIFVCNHHATPSSQTPSTRVVDLQHKDSKSKISSIVFEVETSLACHETLECALQYDGHSYDLSPLIRDTYWRVDAVDGGDDYTYLINVCQEVNAPEFNCEDTGGCQVVVGHDPFSIGLPSSPTFSDGNLVLEYTNGTDCGTGEQRSMTITFECDRTAGVQGSITALPEKKQCHYEFIWETSVACPLETEVDDGCQVTDDRTGQVFDLTDLRDLISKKDITVQGVSDTYHIGLCSKAKFCAGNDAVCTEKKVSQGVANSELSYNQDSLFLTYLHGDSCVDGRKRSTTIKFVCDENADGSSGPSVVHDDGCLLELEWKVATACPQQFENIDCIAYNGIKRYDLTRLLDPTSNYNAEDVSKHLTFHINICRPVVLDRIQGCGRLSGACAVDGDGKATSLGLAVSGPKYENVDGKDTLYINYNNGTNGASSRIEFICADDQSDYDLNSLIYEGFDEDKNRYLFRMYTQFACEVRVWTGSNCMFRDSVTGMEMDFHALQRETPYTLTDDDGGYEYSINMCKQVPCDSSTSNAGACQKKKGEGDKNMGQVSMQPSFENNILKLTYFHGDKCADGTLKRRTVIELVCDPSEQEQGPTFIGEDSKCLYLFQWKTQHACKPQIGHCSAVDPNTGAEYDLDALIRKDYSLSVDGNTVEKSPGNWLVLDNREDNKYEYKINVCRPLVADPKISCGPFAAACQTDVIGRNHYTLGYPMKGPEVVDNQLQIQYTFGEATLCQNYRSATIKFTCNKDAGSLGTPVFEYEGNDCDYVFSWHSSAACPRGGSDKTTATTSTTGPFVVNTCTITHPDTGELIDLSGLTSNGALHVEGKDPMGTLYDFYVGVCSEASDGSSSSNSNCKGSGACQVAQDGSHVSLGNLNHHLYFDGDFLMVNYRDGPICHGQYKRQTTVVFLCDRKLTDAPELVYIEETGECNYRFEVHTAKVCPHTRFSSCTAIDPKTNDAFDLALLSSEDEDYGVEIPDVDGSSSSSSLRLNINICRSLVKPASGCESFYSACLSDNNHGIPLGLPSSPYVNNDHELVMHYTAPGCNGAASGSTNTTILFQCSTDGKEHNPVLVSKASSRTCNFVIVWQTQLACTGSTGSSTSPAPSTDLTKKDCVIADEYERFDLSGLQAQIAQNANEDDNGPYQYKVAACEEIKCGNHASAVCQSQGSASWSLGHFTEKPTISSNGIYEAFSLTYTHGDPCGGKDRSSRVVFECERDANVQGVFFEGETKTCEYEFTWLTDAVCPSQSIPHHDLTCAVSDPKTGRVYRLDKLIRTNAATSNWLARNEATSDGTSNSDFQFYINVCRPLAPKEIGEGLLDEVCRGSGVCQVTGDGRSFSGGYAVSEPEITEDGDVILRYELPSSFETKCHNQFVRSAIITFTCQEGTLGTPSFVGESEECEYQFVWPTAVVCDYQHQQGKDCRVTDPDTGSVFDLSPLAGTLSTVHASDGYDYQLAVCTTPKDKDFTGCSDSEKTLGGCQTGSYAYTIGEVNDNLFITSAGVGLEYTGGQRCHSEAFDRSVYIEFVCNEDAGNGTPEFVSEEDDCSYIFRWETAHACEKKTDFECVLEDSNGHQYDLTPLKRLDSYWLVQNKGEADKYMYAINVCHNIVPIGNAGGCPENSAVCQWEFPITDASNYYNLGQSGEPHWSDGVITIEYNHGTLCQHTNSPRKTVLTLVCNEDNNSGEPLGTPFFLDENDCEYHIHWETKAACPVDVEPETPIDSDVCVFEDPNTDAVIDLSRIDTSSLVFEENGVTFSFDPCQRSRCDGKSSFACQTTHDGDYSIGTKRSVLFRDNSVSMHLFSGSYCELSNKNREAFIIFECPEGGSEGSTELVFTSEQSCSYNFVVRTPVACVASPQQCVVKDTRFNIGWEYDLGPLSKQDYLSVQSEQGEIVFNLCKGVTHDGCPSNAGACLITNDNEYYAIGLYMEGTQPQMKKDKDQIHLTYEGDCPHSSKGSSVEVVFTCQQGTEGTPKLARISGCTYQIEWPTCRVCEGSDPCKDLDTTKTPKVTQGTTRAPGSTTASSNGNTGGKKKTSGGVTFAIILIVFGVLGGSAYILMSPEQKSRLKAMLPGATKRSYKQMKQKTTAGRGLFDDESSSDEGETLFGIGAGDGSSSDDNEGSNGRKKKKGGDSVSFALQDLDNDEESLGIVGGENNDNGNDNDDVALVSF
eukprot:m.20764 g.20764  ORF g.20764 m.20764 type:complete len:2603 (-) comp5284_c0_seq1:1579-9387(-)